MKIVVGLVWGLEYLYDKVNLLVIYWDFKLLNILLDEGFYLKLLDFGLVKLGLVGDKMYVLMWVMGMYGYCVLEYVMMG